MRPKIGIVQFALCLIGIITCSAYAEASSFSFSGPQLGPKKQTNKHIILIASDFQNGGVAAVIRGFQDAAKVLEWRVQVENGAGNKDTQKKILSSALGSTPDGIIFCGFLPDDLSGFVSQRGGKKISLVGWHSVADPGPTKDLFYNVTTHARDVARLAADFVISDAKARNRKVGVVLFNDSEFAIANLKTAVMKDSVQKCRGYKGCKVLAAENVSISRANEEIPSLVPKLVDKFGRSWTYGLAINDVYYDSIHFPLSSLNRSDISLISAGDGSEKAIARIKDGRTRQIATVAEPLREQGFQLADELNRSFAGAKPSGYVSKPLLITRETLLREGKESTPDYERAYKKIWLGESKEK